MRYEWWRYAGYYGCLALFWLAFGLVSIPVARWLYRLPLGTLCWVVGAWFAFAIVFGLWWDRRQRMS